MKLNPLTSTDAYKSGHIFQYPRGTTMVYSNFTPRSGKLAPIPENLFNGNVVNFGLQHWIKSFLIETWNTEFFFKYRAEVVRAYRRRVDNMLGPGVVPVDHIEALHDLGYLPICIKALPEGAISPVQVPVLVIYNTVPEFYWVTNYLETALSASLWKPMTSATIAAYYRILLDRYATETGTPAEFTQYQGHDFSFRGMSSIEDGALSGAAHLLSFVGTDTIAAIDLLEQYYHANSDLQVVGTSVPATEHSVMCMGGDDNEIETFRRLIEDVYPRGIVSIVSDTWDFWEVVSGFTIKLKDKILARAGKLVFRPDSGDPVKIVCGDPEAPEGTPEHKGAVGCLWDVFGGTVNSEGYKMLDDHVGLIYGDSITLPRADAILAGLKAKGFASSNIVLGIGSFTYQFNTRDSFGFAVKSTYGEINGAGREIFKDPKTDNGAKKSARGLIAVKKGDNGCYFLNDRQPKIDMPGDELKEVFRDGRLLVDHAFGSIRLRLATQLWKLRK